MRVLLLAVPLSTTTQSENQGRLDPVMSACTYRGGATVRQGVLTQHIGAGGLSRERCSSGDWGFDKRAGADALRRG
jgi:hypothetical protein